MFVNFYRFYRGVNKYIRTSVLSHIDKLSIVPEPQVYLLGDRAARLYDNSFHTGYPYLIIFYFVFYDFGNRPILFGHTLVVPDNSLRLSA